MEDGQIVKFCAKSAVIVNNAARLAADFELTKHGIELSVAIKYVTRKGISPSSKLIGGKSFRPLRTRGMFDANTQSYRRTSGLGYTNRGCM